MSWRITHEKGLEISNEQAGVDTQDYGALLRVARAAKFYLEHGEPELADDLEEALKEVERLL